MEVLCTLTREQATLYQAVVDEMLARRSRRSEGIERRGRVLATLTALKQVCNHPAQFPARRHRAGRAVRQARAARGDARGGHRGRREGAGLHPVRASWADLLPSSPRSALRPRGAVPARRHAGKPSATRWSTRFQGRTARRVFLLSLKAGGTGLNLTAATTSSTSTAGGTRPSRTRPPTGPSGSARRGGPGPQVGLRRHARGADRRADRGEARPGRADAAPARAGSPS